MVVKRNEPCYVLGVGMTKFIKPRGKVDYTELGFEAGIKAMLDAQINYDDVDQGVACYCYGDSTCGQRVFYQFGMTHIPIYNVNNNCSTGSTGLALARNVISHGGADCILVVGFEKMNPGSLQSFWNDRSNPTGTTGEMMRITRGVTNAPGAAQMFGNAGREYMEKYGAKNEDFAEIARVNHEHSQRNPYSQFQDVYSLEQIMKAPMIHEPLTKLQCCPTSDGGAAAVLVSQDFLDARPHLKEQAILIAGQCMATDAPSLFSKSAIDLMGFEMTKYAAKTAMEEAQVTPADVKVCELHDCFSASPASSPATSPASSSKKAADVKCVETTKGWVCAICFPLDDPNRALERVLSLAQLQAHAAANHYASLGQNEWDNYVTKSVYYEAQFKGQRDLGLDGGIMQGPPTVASQKKLTKPAGVPKRKYVRKNKTAVPESALDLMETMINFDGNFTVNDDHFSTNTPAFPGGSQDEDNGMINLTSAPNTPRTPFRNVNSYDDQLSHSQFEMDVSHINTTPTTPPTAIVSRYGQPSHSQFEMGVSHATTTPTTPKSSNDSYYNQSTHSRFGMHSMDAPPSVASPSTPSRKKSSASKNPLRQRLSENPSFESAVSVHGLDQVRAAGNAGLQRYLDRQARGLPRTANGSLPLTSPSAPRNGTLGLPLTAANYAAAGMPNIPVEKVVRRAKKVERRRQSSTASSIAGGPDGDASPLVVVTTDTSLNQFGVPATLFGQAPRAVYKSHAYESIYAVLAPKEQLPQPEVSLPEIPAGLYLPELAHSEDSGAVASSLEQFQGEVLGASEPTFTGNDGADDFNFESFSSEPWSRSEENATAPGNAVPPMSNEAFAEFLASISTPAVSEIDAMFGFGNRSRAPSNLYDNFTVFHTTSLEYGVPSQTAQAARPASPSSRSAPPAVEGSPSSTCGEVEPLVGTSDRVELAPEVVGPSALESVAEASAPEAEARVINSPEMAELMSFVQKQLDEQQTKFEAALRKQSEGQSAANAGLMKKLEEKSAALEKLARREEVRAKAAATAEDDRLRLEARQKRSKMTNHELFGIAPGRTVGNGKPTVTTKDHAKKRVGPSKKPVPAKNHTPVVKEAVPAAKKTSPGGPKLASAAKKAPVGGAKAPAVSATTKVGVPSTKMTTFSLLSGAPAGFKRSFVKNHGVKVATNKPLGAAFDRMKATPTPAKPTVPTQSASVPKKRAAASKPAPSGQKPSGVTKKGPSKDRNSDQKYLARAMLSKKGPQRVNVPDPKNGGWMWVNVSEL